MLSNTANTGFSRQVQIDGLRWPQGCCSRFGNESISLSRTNNISLQKPISSNHNNIKPCKKQLLTPLHDMNMKQISAIQNLIHAKVNPQ